MKIFEKFIETTEEEDWVTLSNGNRVLINKDTGEIKSGALKGTNIKDYKKNVKKLPEEDEDEK